MIFKFSRVIAQSHVYEKYYRMIDIDTSIILLSYPCAFLMTLYDGGTAGIEYRIDRAKASIS